MTSKLTPELKQLRSDLNSRARRHDAYEKLRRLGPSAAALLPDLTRRAASNDAWEVGHATAACYFVSPSPEHLDALAKLLGHKYLDARIISGLALEAIPSARPQVEWYLKHGNVHARKIAQQIIARWYYMDPAVRARHLGKKKRPAPKQPVPARIKPPKKAKAKPAKVKQQLAAKAPSKAQKTPAPQRSSVKKAPPKKTKRAVAKRARR